MRIIMIALLLFLMPAQTLAQAQGTDLTEPQATEATNTDSTMLYLIAGVVSAGVVADILTGGALSGPLFSAVGALVPRVAGTCPYAAGTCPYAARAIVTTATRAVAPATAEASGLATGLAAEVNGMATGVARALTAGAARGGGAAAEGMTARYACFIEMAGGGYKEMACPGGWRVIKVPKALVDRAVPALLP